MLSLAGASTGLLVVGAALPACGNPTGTPPTGPVDVGNISALSVGTMLTMSNVVVARDATGVYAMRLISALIGSVLLAAAVRALAAAISPRLAVVGVLAAVTPTAYFIMASVNPNGIEIAAGVIPGMRLACPRDRGWSRESFSTTSRESPGSE